MKKTYLSLFGCNRIDLHLLGLRISNRVLEFLQARLTQLDRDRAVHIVQPHRHALVGVVGLTQLTLHKNLRKMDRQRADDPRKMSLHGPLPEARVQGSVLMVSRSEPGKGFYNMTILGNLLMR